MKIRTMLAGAVGLALISSLGLGVAPASAAPAAPAVSAVAAAPAASAKAAMPFPFEDDNFACPKTLSGSVYIGSCDGYWYSANPGQRSLEIYLKPVTMNTSGTYHTASLVSARSVDGQPHVLNVYCSYPNGTTSAMKSSVQVGGNHANVYTWGGLDPCPGVDGGVWINIKGWYGGSRAYLGKVHINDWFSGGLRQACDACEYI